VLCAFDGPPARTVTTSPPQEDSTICAILDVTPVETTLPVQPAPLASTGESLSPRPVVHPLWSLALSIDHPPERPV
jgi:hypothetical protein